MASGNRYNFSSSFGEAGDALQAFLLRREAERRQALLDELNRKQVEAQMANAQAQLANATEARALNREQFAYQQNRDVAEDEFRNEQARTAAQERSAAAEAQRAFQSEQNELNRSAQAEGAAGDREMREIVARIGADSRAGSNDILNQLRQTQIDTNREKLESTRTERERSESAARTTTQSALDAVNRLLDPKDAGRNIGVATGAYELRGFSQGAQDFNAVRDQLVAALTQPNLGQLKGPMSDKDIVFVKQLATRLANTRMSEAETRRALQEARTFLQGKLGTSAPAGNNASDYRSRYGY